MVWCSRNLEATRLLFVLKGHFSENFLLYYYPVWFFLVRQTIGLVLDRLSVGVGHQD